MKEYGDREPVREQLDKEVRDNPGRPSIRKYCDPVLWKPNKKDPVEPLPFPAGGQWLLLFTEITIAKELRGRNIDKVLVREALDVTLLLAGTARRPLLAAVEPGCVQLKRLYISDRRKFREWYGSIWKHWPVVQAIKARQEKFWLEMGFQRFEKPEFNRDLSNFLFWSGHFQLPEVIQIDLSDLEKQPEGLEGVVADGNMIMPEKNDARRVRPRRNRVPETEPEEPEESDKMEVDDGGEAEIDERPAKRARMDVDDGEAEVDKRPEESDKMEVDDGGEAEVDKRPAKRARTDDDDGEAAAADESPEKRSKLADDMEVDPVELPQTFEATDQIGDGDIFDCINWPDWDRD